MAYKFQKGAAIMSGALAQEGTLEVLDDANGLQAQMTSAGVVSGSGNFQGGASATFVTSVTAGSSFIIGSADLNEADMEKLDGITNGAAAANKALVLDANKDIGTIRNLTIDGVFTDGNYTFDTSGNVSGLGTVGCGAITSGGNLGVTGTITGDTSLTLDAVTMTTAEMTTITGVTAGTAAASKALVLDANKDIATIRNLTIDGTFSDGNYTFDTSGNVTGLGTVGCGAVTSSGAVIGTSVSGSGLVSGGTLTIADAAILNGTLKPAGVAAAAITQADDSMFFLDSDGLMKKTTQVLYAAALVASEPGFASSNGKLQFDPSSLSAATPATGDALSFVDSDDSNIPKKATFDAFAGVLAGGTGISASGVALSLDLNELTAAAVDVSADSLAIIDAGDSNASKKESIADLVSAMAGAGLSASGGQLSAAGSGDSISVASVADTGTMAAGLNYTATQTGAIAVSLPAVAGAQDGDIIYLKANSGTSSTNKITVSCDTGDKVDGVANGTVIVESPFASVGFIYVHATTNWSLI
jgi:hypothetical protein